MPRRTFLRPTLAATVAPTFAAGLPSAVGLRLACVPCAGRGYVLATT